MAKGTKTGGRQRGTPNKVTKDVRQMVLAALNTAGGEGYLLAQSKENPAAFMTLVGKCLPKDVNVTGEVTTSGTVHFVGTDAPTKP